MPATRWAMLSMRALRRPWRSALTVSGERFANATTPYNNLMSAATGLTDSCSRRDSPGHRRLSSSWTCRSPRPSISIYRIVRTDTAISARPTTRSFGALSAARDPDLQGNRLHRLPGAHALQAVLAGFLGRVELRHHGTREPVLLTRQLQCGVDSSYLRCAGNRVVRRKHKVDARNIAKLRFRGHRLADPGSGHYAGLLQNPPQEHHWNRSVQCHLR